MTQLMVYLIGFILCLVNISNQQNRVITKIEQTVVSSTINGHANISRIVQSMGSKLSILPPRSSTGGTMMVTDTPLSVPIGQQRSEMPTGSKSTIDTSILMGQSTADKLLGETLLEFPTGEMTLRNKPPIETPLSFPMRQSLAPTSLFFPRDNFSRTGRQSQIRGRQLPVPLNQSTGNRFRSRTRNSFSTRTNVEARRRSPVFNPWRQTPLMKSKLGTESRFPTGHLSEVLRNSVQNKRPIIGSLSSPMEENPIIPYHPDYNSKYYLIDIILQRPSSTSDTTLEVLQSINTIFRSMSINNLISEDAFKIVGRPRVHLVVKGIKGSTDVASSIERVARSLERLGTTVETTLLYSLESFVESTASKLMPLSSLVNTTRAPIRDLKFNTLFLCRLTVQGRDMNKLRYVSQTLNSTLDMMNSRAAGRLEFKGYRIAGTIPFEFQFYIHQKPADNELSAIKYIPLLNAGNVQMKTEEVQPLEHVLQTIGNTQTVNLVPHIANRNGNSVPAVNYKA